MAASTAPHGLTATELAAVIAELQPRLAGAEVQDVGLLASNDDLLLVLRTPTGKAFLQIAPGGTRARVTTTACRLPKDAFAAGPKADALRARLAGATLIGIDQPAGERRCELHLRSGRGEQHLMVELFGARGLWAVLDAARVVCELSRPVTTAVRSLAIGQPYSAPPPSPTAAAEPPPRFADAAGVDAHFTAQDRAAAVVAERDRLLRLCERAVQKAQAKATGLATQLADAGRSAALRAEADLMLAYAHAVPRGAARMVVPDPLRDDAERSIELDPARPVHLQARDRYERARRLDDGRAIAEQRLQAARAELQQLATVGARLADAALAANAAGAADDDPFAAARAALQALGLLARTRSTTGPPPRDRERRTKGLDCRQFVSAEGYPILVGRNNEQNDRLTLHVAKGNDLWLHVGGGRPGSHVIVRLPKGKTASLETLLDAGTLAIHFSKARGERVLDVVYTQRKHVRKPKGLPAGAVLPSQTRTITVRLDEERLRRLLSSGDAADEP